MRSLDENYEKAKQILAKEKEELNEKVVLYEPDIINNSQLNNNNLHPLKPHLS